jgi:hypothetical protein
LKAKDVGVLNRAGATPPLGPSAAPLNRGVAPALRHTCAGCFVHDQRRNREKKGFSSIVGNLRIDADASASPTLGISPLNPNTMMAQAAAGIVRSSDGGKTWSPVGQQAGLNMRA